MATATMTRSFFGNTNEDYPPEVAGHLNFAAKHRMTADRWYWERGRRSAVRLMKKHRAKAEWHLARAREIISIRKGES